MASIVPTDVADEVATIAEPITVVGVATGTAAADRLNVVTISTRDGRSVPSGVTINGIAATKLADLSPGANMFLSIWGAANPSGTTGNVVISFAGSNTSIGLGMSVFALYGAGLIPVDSDAGNNTLQAITLSGVTIPAGGVAIWAQQNGDQNTTVTWTNATEWEDQFIGNSRSSSAYSTTAGTPSVTASCDLAGANVTAMIGVAFGLPPAISYFGSASVPADGAAATNATATLTITPPASMLVGDLVVVMGMSRNSATWTNGITGGQTWTALTAFNGTGGPYCRFFWCRFNGTWGANPRFDSTSATCTSAIMHVFRPASMAHTWAIDVAQASAAYTAALNTDIVGLTTVHADAISLAVWTSLDDNTLGNLQSIGGSGWLATGAAQYRNTSGSDQSAGFAHHIDTTAGSVVPNARLDQLTQGPDAGVTAIVAWYATGGGAALTKAVADGLTLSDVRSGIAQYIRGLPDAMTMNEALARVAVYLRSIADPLTMSESVSAVKALVRAFIDPLTIGENVTAIKSLLRAYADALILSELVDKQLTMAAYSDNFNRADSGTPGASWNENVAGVAIIDNELGFTATGAWSSVVWTQPVAVSCQYQKATLWRNPDTSVLAGMLFRCSNTTNGSCYRIVFDTNTDGIGWDNVPNMTDPTNQTTIATAAMGMTPGDTWGVTVELLGNNTVVRIWKNPTGLPTRANNWNGDTTPDVTFTQNPATPRDAGTFLGLTAAPLEAGVDLGWENWFGGGCLESTGVLWSKELFDNLVMSEALAKVATLFRSGADPIVLSEAMNRVAVLQRACMDGLTLGENVVKARSLVRAYAETLILGEALSKRIPKSIADVIVLSEAFAKQLQIARAMANPMTVGEVLAKQMQFNRSLIDPITINESLVRQLQRFLLLVDTMTLDEVIAVLKPSKSVADAIVLNEVLKKQINKGLLDLIGMNEVLVKFFGKKVADLITLNEALTKVSTFSRTIANPITLSELVTKQKQIGKALSETIAIGEVLTKIFVAIKNLADPIVVGETISKQFGKGLSDLISIEGFAHLAFQFGRSLADPITLSEALSRQMQLKRSLADLMTMGEAIQKTVVLVRSIANSMTMGESVGRSSAFARSQVDMLTLNEALAKMIGYTKVLSDSMTMADTLVKSAAFRRSLSDLMSMADAGTQNLLRHFLRSYADPITMGDAVIKLFVLLRAFSDSLNVGEQVFRVMAYHRLPVDTISLGEVFARVAVYKRSVEDALSLGESLNGISAFRITARDLIDLSEALQVTGILEKDASDPITLSDVIDTKFILFDEAWARRPYNIGTGDISCH